MEESVEYIVFRLKGKKSIEYSGLNSQYKDLRQV